MSNIFFKSVFGSQLYGTSVPSSDTDYKGLMLPKFKDIILQRAPQHLLQNTNNSNTKNSQEDVDFEVFSLHQWFKLFCEGQTMTYDMLFTPDKFIITSDPIWTHIVQNKDKLVNSKISAFAGYCSAQASKYSLKGSNLTAFRMATDFFALQNAQTKLESIRDDIIKYLVEVGIRDDLRTERNELLIQFVYIKHKTTGVDEEYLQVGPKTKVPMSARCGLAADIFKQQFDKYGERAKQAESNDGVDWKALLHAHRICEEAIELLLTGNITFPRPEASTLLKIRKGEMEYRAVADLIVGGLDQLTLAKSKTTLRAEPDREWVDNFVFNIYSSLGQL